MKQFPVRAFGLTRFVVVAFFAMSLVLMVSISKPWAAGRITPSRLVDIEPSKPDPGSIGSFGSSGRAGKSHTLNKFLDPESAVVTPPLADIFTKNQSLWAAQSPATIPWDYDVTGGPPASNVIAVGTPVHIVYGIQVASNNASSSPISLKITLPAGFTRTSMRCAKFVGVGHSGTTPPSCTLSSLPTFSIGALTGGEDKVLVAIDGYFNQAGAFSVAFEATRDATTESTLLNMSADVLNLPVDISVTKEVKLKTGGTFGPSTSTPFGGTVIYKLTIKNESVPDPINHATDLYLGPLLHLRDTLSAPNTNGVTITINAQIFNCSSTTGADCPTVPTGALISLGAGGSHNFAFNYPATSNGFLPAGGSFEITFEATISTSATCTNAPTNELRNTAHFTYSNGNKTVSDTNPANNTSNPTTIVNLTGSFTQCISITLPGISVSKKLLSPATPVWGVPFTYEITITNTSTQTLVGLGLNDLVRGIGTPPFTATFNAGSGNPVCTPACIAPAPTSTAPLVSGGFSFLFSLNFAALSPGAVQTVQYQVQYDTSCATSTVAGSINNRAQLTGSATGLFDLTTPMPALPVCELTVEKTQTSGPTSFASFPVTLGYKVEFKNTSPNQTIKVGTMVDAMALDSATYGVNLPIDYSYSCTATSVTMPGAAILNKPPSTAANLQFNNPLRVGVRLINFQGLGNAVFLPGGVLSCDVSVTLKQPPTNDSLCQGAGTPNVVNTAFADLAPGFNPFSQPAFEDSVVTPLPKCVSILVRKNVAPNVVAGGSVTFTLSVKNVGNDPIFNITLNDNVPIDFTNVAWTCASGCSTPSGSGNNISIPLTPIAAGATTTILVTATAPIILGSYCNSTNAIFNPFPALTYFEGNQNELTQASACVQVKSPEPTTPTLTKSFDPVQIASNGTSTLTFNITNANGDPKQTDISFSDTLPTGLQFDSVISNGCSGNVSISSDGKTVALTGGQLVGANSDGSGKHSCQIAVKVKATGECGVYKNNKDNFSRVTNLDVSGVNQQLEVIGCNESCEVKSNEVSCKADGGGYLYTFTVTNNTGLVVTDVLLTPAPGSGITLNPKQPQLPAGGMAIGGSLTFQVTITGGQPQQQACFDVTLMTTDGECCTRRVCPVLPDCCGIVRDENIECNRDGTYTYTLSVVNTGANTIEHVYLYPPDGVTMTPNYFAVSLKPGDTFTTKVIIKGAKPGDKLCFGISLHSADMESCCKGEHCIVLPACPLPARP